jgi:hypothetical protein
MSDAGTPSNGPEGKPEGQPPPSDKGNPPPPESEGKPKPLSPEDVEGLKNALSEERKARREAEAKFTKLERDHMSETEKAIATAKDEGRKEAIQSAGRRLAAAEFKAAAAGKIGDPEAALEVLDLTKFVGEDGEPDKASIQKVVDRLSVAMPVQTPNGRVPAGPRSDEGVEGTDFIRQALRPGR